jgi:hypothetical protein
MKIAGRKIEGINKKRIVIPREDGDIILVAQGVTSYKEFEEICKMPDPPVRTYPDGRKEVVKTDENYKKACDKWAARRTS